MVAILVVEHAPMRDGLVAALHGSYDLEIADTLADARRCLRRRAYDAVVLDVVQPDGDGLELIAELRADRSTARLPVLVVTERDDVGGKVAGFAVGCDDWLPSRVHPLELRARVEARLREHRDSATLTLPGLQVDLCTQRAALVGDDGSEQPLALTAHELKLLVHFARHVDHVLDREGLLTAVWGLDVAVLDRTVDTHVGHLRRKLTGSRWTIEAVPRLGYRFTRR